MTRRGWCCMRAGCKSTHERRDGGAGRYYEEEETRRPAPSRTTCALRACRHEASIVPADSISGRALLAVIAIMTFLAALTLGAVVLVRSAAGEWQSAVAREITIQLRPSDQRDIEADVATGRGARSGDAGYRVACGPTARKNPRSCWSRGSAAGWRSASCRCRA